MSTSIVGFGTADTFAELLQKYGDVIPAYPGEGVVVQARVPVPPVLDAAKPHTHFDALVNAYRAAVAHRQHLRSFAKLKPSLELVAAANVLCEKTIAPAAWCVWSVACWTKLPTNVSKVMPVGWVYSLSRLENQRWAFHKENGCTGGQTRAGQKHLRLLERWALMKRYLNTSGPYVNAIGVAAVVNSAFPRGLYKVMVEEARLEAETLQAEINAEVEAGTFPW